MTESEIITRILSGEEELFSRLVDRYCGYVWALCSSYVRNPSDCEDVSQEVFVQCYRRLNTLRNPGAFGAWLCQLARRHCLMWLRTSSRREQLNARYEQDAGGARGHGAGMALNAQTRDELQASVWEAIDQLPPDYREALLLKFGEGYSIVEAASFLGITPAAMRKRIERGQKMLKDRFWDQVEPALAEGKHKQELARGVLAAIPFGKAPWLSTAGSGALASAVHVPTYAWIGGVVVMSKKLVGGLLAVLLLIALAFLATNNAKQADSKPQQAPVVFTKKIVGAKKTTPSPAAPVAPAPSEAPSPPAATPAPAGVPEARTASISGYVEDRELRPLSGADIHLEIGRDRYCSDVAKTYDTKTGADGRYKIAGIDTFGNSNVFASAEGCVMQRNHADLVAGAEIKDVNFTLQQAEFYVAGQVIGSGKTPIAGASVQTLYFGYDEEGLARTAADGGTTGNISGSKFLFALTDKTGHFKVAIPEEGLCDFQVTKQGFASGFFPKIPTGTEDARFVIGAGGAISGRVTNTSGVPMENVTVRVTGEALPGGLAPSPVRIQTLPIAPIIVTTDALGNYLAKGLGEAYTYSVMVPGPEADGKSAADPQRTLIAASIRELDEDVFGTQSFRARKTGIQVADGQTTKDVDLVIGAITGALVHGKVTDRTTGKPVCPVVVAAGALEDDAASSGGESRLWFQTAYGASSVTDSSGAYELQIQDLSKVHRFSLHYAFMTEGGSAWEQPNEDLAVLELTPGEQRELDFTVDAPVTVPARYVDTNGAPIAGVMAAMRQAGGKGGCGGSLISGADGRVTFHGVRPLESLQVIAWLRAQGDLKTIGASEPFTGQPGETVPEVTVVCRMLGGIEGTVIYADGRPAANMELTCQAQLASESEAAMEAQVTTNANGAVSILDSMPEGVYRSIRLSFLERASGQAYSAAAQDIQIDAGMVSDLGTLVAQPEKDALRVVEMADGGRKGNEAIAALYSPDLLDKLSDSSQFYKTGFAMYDAERYQEALDVFVRMSKMETMDSADLARSLVWQGQMLDLMGKRPEAIAAYTQAADMNITGVTRHDQFGLSYAPSVYARERIQKPFVRLDNNMP